MSLNLHHIRGYWVLFCYFFRLNHKLYTISSGIWTICTLKELYPAINRLHRCFKEQRLQLFETYQQACFKQVSNNVTWEIYQISSNSLSLSLSIVYLPLNFYLSLMHPKDSYSAGAYYDVFGSLIWTFLECYPWFESAMIWECFHRASSHSSVSMSLRGLFYFLLFPATRPVSHRLLHKSGMVAYTILLYLIQVESPLDLLSASFILKEWDDWAHHALKLVVIPEYHTQRN